jgi:hypothetical protein
MDAEPDTLDLHEPPEEQAGHEADDELDWDLDERDRYMAAHEDLEEHPEIDVVVRSDE